MPRIDVGTALEADAALPVDARIRRSLAATLLSGAEFFASEAMRIETDTAATMQSSYGTIRHFVIGAVLLSAASVEAHLNEVMAAENTPKWFLDLVRPRNTIERHKYYLELKDKSEFATDDQLVEQVNLLFDLRNALMHFRPAWDDEEGHHSQLGRRLDRVFQMSPLVPAGTAPTFPTRCMSHGCAAWATNTAKAFMQDFAQRLGR